MTRNKLRTKMLHDLYALPSDLKPQAAPHVSEMILELLPEPCRVLIVGAGRGGMAKVLGAHGYDLTNIDLHPEHFNVEGQECKQVDVMKGLPFKDNTFDLILAVEVMEHLENPWSFFGEAIRCLDNNGSFVFTSPNVQTIFARWLYLTSGILPYFRLQSFEGCYHVTPIFDWSVSRCCRTLECYVDGIYYSRVGTPSKKDIPVHYYGRLRKLMYSLIPCNKLFGEISAYIIKKDKSKNITSRVEVGKHCS